MIILACIAIAVVIAIVVIVLVTKMVDGMDEIIDVMDEEPFDDNGENE